MKKILSLLLVLAMLFAMAGCQLSNAPEQSDPLTTQAESTATQPETTVAPETAEPPVTDPPATQPQKQPEATRPTVTPSTQPEETDPLPTDPVETQPEEQPPLEPPEEEPTPTEPAPQKSYTHKDEVAKYIHEHGRLPDNFITKSQAKALGWRSGSLEKYAPGKCIGGDRFYNKEGLLPQGHTYYECDIDTLGSSSRGAKRIVFSSDGLIYYTSDHYRSFTLLYGEP